MALEGIQNALREQVTEDMVDITTDEMPFLATLKGFDAFYKTPGQRYKVGGSLTGEALQETFAVGKPSVREIDANQSNFDQLRTPLQRGTSFAGTTFVATAFDVHETISKYQVNRYKGHLESLTDYVMKMSELLRSAMHEKWSQRLFPPTNPYPTIAAGYNGAPRIDQLGSVVHALQTGYVLNAATGTGTYDYLGMDLNLTRFNRLKARNSGTTTAPFGTPSTDNLRGELVRTRNKGGRPDIYICDTETFSFLGDVIEDYVRIQNGEKLTFGGTRFNLLGLDMLVEPRMDLLSDGFSDEDLSVSATEYRESYMLTSANHRWRNTPIDDMLIEDVQGAASLQVAQGYYEACYWNANPRGDSRQFNVTGV